MADMMTFPNTVEEFMEQYKITDTEQVYTNCAELVPIFRMKQWFDHKPEQQWIPVSERLPKLGQLVLVTSAIDGDIHLCTQCATDGQMFIMDGTKYHVLGEAWMPCPEPYKGDTDGQP